jgi:hypothetical protein
MRAVSYLVLGSVALTSAGAQTSQDPFGTAAGSARMWPQVPSSESWW